MFANKAIIFLLFITLYSTISFSSEYEINPKDNADFNKLNKYVMMSNGTACITDKMATWQQSSRKEVNVADIMKQAMIVQQKFTKECMCSKEAKDGHAKAASILKKHEDWKWKKITNKHSEKNSLTIDLGAYKRSKKLLSSICK